MLAVHYLFRFPKQRKTKMAEMNLGAVVLHCHEHTVTEIRILLAGSYMHCQKRT